MSFTGFSTRKVHAPSAPSAPPTSATLWANRSAAAFISPWIRFAIDGIKHPTEGEQGAHTPFRRQDEASQGKTVPRSSGARLPPTPWESPWRQAAPLSCSSPLAASARFLHRHHQQAQIRAQPKRIDRSEQRRSSESQKNLCQSSVLCGSHLIPLDPSRCQRCRRSK